MRDVTDDAGELVVCTTCRCDWNTREGPTDGECLSAALTARAIPHRRQRCLSACRNGCAVVLRAPHRWSFVQGRLHPDRDVDALIAMLDLWRHAPAGLVAWRARPEIIRLNTIARIPPLETRI